MDVKMFGGGGVGNNTLGTETTMSLSVGINLEFPRVEIKIKGSKCSTPPPLMKPCHVGIAYTETPIYCICFDLQIQIGSCQCNGI